MKKGLVSLITPCYNGENLIHRLLDSVLEQDYPLIEMFVVDDGSTDNSKEVILSYLDKFQDKGYQLTYIYQENAGQAAAINNALKLVKGEFLAWPDCDDFYCSKSSISEFVKKFEDLDDSYGYIRCNVKYINDQTLKLISVREFNSNEENLFNLFLSGEESLACAGLYMVKMRAFEHVNPNRQLYTYDHPQNLQLILPISYSFKCYTITKTLYSVLVRRSSHSRDVKSLECRLKDIDGYINIYNNALNAVRELSIIDKELHIRGIKEKFLNAELSLCITDKNKDKAKEVANKMKDEGVRMDLRRRVRLFLLMYCSFISRVINI